MEHLRLEKDKQRAARHDKKLKDEASRPKGIRTKIPGRGPKLQAKKNNPRKLSLEESNRLRECPEHRDIMSYEDIAEDIENDITVAVKRKSRRHEKIQNSSDVDDHQLDAKRQRAVYQKRVRLEQEFRAVKEKEKALECRRAENVAMKGEDILARLIEQKEKRRERLRARKVMVDRVASSAVFKCMHEMNGRRFLISVYIKNAHGYEPDGLRIVAYDPSSSAAFTMIMTLREFNSLGYGRTSEGFGAFCKWFCLLYEKRRRQFRLVWSGAPCPPPLRVREYDQSLVCIHKEGVKMQHKSKTCYSLVAVYLRTDNPSVLRFVVGAWNDGEFILTEHAVEGRRLIIGTDLDIQWSSPEHPAVVWKHTADAFNSEGSNGSATLTNAIGARVYSSEVVLNCSRYIANVHDTNENEYTVELIPKSNKNKIVCNMTPVDTPGAIRLLLHKRKINPYDVHLSSTNFADLLSLTRFDPILPGAEQNRDTDSHEKTHIGLKANVSPKWTAKLANYVRAYRLAKYACKIGGVFCFVTAFAVQQKTEFRAHLLLEVTSLTSALLSLGGVGGQQSVRIPLSEYLHCANASRCITARMGYDENEREDECTACQEYTAARATFFHSADHSVPEMPLDYSTSCPSCNRIQCRRLAIIKELVIHGGLIAPVSLEFIYHAYCEVCTNMVPPLLLVLGSVFSATASWLVPLLGHYLSCFDSTQHGLFNFIEGHTISDESSHVRDTLLQTLARDQAVLIFNADCGTTVGSANLFVNELHWWLYPDCTELPCHVAYIVANEGSGFEHNAGWIQRDFDLVEALRTLNNAARQLAEFAPMHLDAEGSDHASAFDAYLVAEAVLVEATRVLLHPDHAWEKPRKIVGASSWSTACRFLLDPAQLSADLQRFNPLQVSAATTEVLEAYFMHAKWPHDYPSVRPFFCGLLSFMMHVHHVHQLLASRSGSLQCASARPSDLASDTSAVHQNLAKNTSVLAFSHQSPSSQPWEALTL
ncbi:unnamed protein product [Phytophthora fragariaefolia]|uniref:Unnamed protein product n=1 Tax=Phytophthora fragariaefolia TaxID=1490495 RepID=A0A9W6XZV5_9STRA|nr:unnamed protein product [Phytophthora fragariaefolia]